MAYEDLNTAFLDPNVSFSSTPTVANINSIKLGLERLITTPKGHNPFNREYGSSLYDLLFENNVSASDAKMFLYMDITDWEPRLDINPNDISIMEIDKNTFRVNCTVRLNGYVIDVDTQIVKE